MRWFTHPEVAFRLEYPPWKPFPLWLLQRQCYCGNIRWVWNIGFGSERHCTDCQRGWAYDQSVAEIAQKLGHSPPSEVSAGETAHIVAQLCEALEYCHPVGRGISYDQRSAALSLLIRLQHPESLPTLGRLIGHLEQALKEPKQWGWLVDHGDEPLKVLGALVSIGTPEARDLFTRGIIASAYRSYFRRKSHQAYNLFDHSRTDYLATEISARMRPKPRPDEMFRDAIKWRNQIILALDSHLLDSRQRLMDILENEDRLVLSWVSSDPHERYTTLRKEHEKVWHILRGIAESLKKGW